MLMPFAYTNKKLATTQNKPTRKIERASMEARKEVEHFCVSAESESSIRANFSNLSIKKKPKARVVREIDEEREIAEPRLDKVDEKSFEEVQSIIGAGQIEKLNVEQCKVYLRKNGLRLTGNKATLILRIKEHLEILNGGGEKKYPVSSFVINCRGDACTGDVVLFEQNVYDMFNIASHGAGGSLCGTRMVSGRIVKESYGAAKQQHTFTIEVLWSKGEKPLPPLHPLLIKGRNLYRLKTLRQQWEDEGERQKILMEKHTRGSLARSDREARIQEKEKRKMLKANRISKQEANRSQSQFDSTLVPKLSLQQNVSLSVNLGHKDKQATGPQQMGFSSRQANEELQAGLAANTAKLVAQPQTQRSGLCVDHDKMTTIYQLEKDTLQDKYIDQASQRYNGNRNSDQEWILHYGIQEVQHMGNQPHSHNRGLNSYSGNHMNWTREFPKTTTHRQPFRSINNYHPMSSSRRQFCAPQKLCRHYAQGRCYYGESCKYSHVMSEECGQRREERCP